MWAIVDRVLSILVVGVGLMASLVGLMVAGFGFTRRTRRAVRL
jgi:hypothetical protein